MLLDLTPRISDSMNLSWCPRICIADKFPGDSYSAVLEATFGE
jgi:hypothetical protein